MDVAVRERTIEEIVEKIGSMDTALNKIIYLESALKETGFGFEIKRFLWGSLSELYSERKMFEKAARAMGNRASLEVMAKDRMESFISAAELYSRVGKVEESEAMFTRASRNVDVSSVVRVKLARKNIYSSIARELDEKGKKGTAVKFYEKLMKMNLEEVERVMIRDKLIVIYKALGMFREARLLEGVE